MKKIAWFIFPFWIFAAQNLCAQTPETTEPIIYIVEKMPEYPGGEAGLAKFLQENIVYPAEAKQQKLEGKVYVSFTIDSLGNVQGVWVKRGVHPLLDNEAVRVIKMFPQWKPGTQAGRAVNVQFNLPIDFSLKSKRR